MKKKKLDSLSEKFKKQKIAQLTNFKGKEIDYACAHGVMGGDKGGHSFTCHTFAIDCTTQNSDFCTPRTKDCDVA